MKTIATRLLFAYWDRLRGERAAPDRGDIEPGEIRHILGDTFILELARDGAEVRLAGTRLCALFGRELRGERFERLWVEDDRADLRRLMVAVADEAAGIVAGLVGTAPGTSPLPLELILLPLARREPGACRLLGALAPNPVPSWIGLQALASVSTASSRVIRPLEEPAPARPPALVVADRRRHLVVHEGGRA